MARVEPELLDSRRYPFTVEISTRFGDMDSNRHINNVAIVQAFEDARVRFQWSAGLRQAVDDAGLKIMIAANHVDYLGEAFYPDPLHVHVGTIAIGRTSWTLGVLATQGGQPCAFARAVIVCSDANGPTPIPQSFRDTIARQMLTPTESA